MKIIREKKNRNQNKRYITTKLDYVAKKVLYKKIQLNAERYIFEIQHYWTKGDSKQIFPQQTTFNISQHKHHSLFYFYY